MKKYRKILLIAAFLTIIAVIGFIVSTNGNAITLFRDTKTMVIFALIIILGIIAILNAFKQRKEEKAGFASEDELSTLIKHKSGYYAYLASMYMWLFIFLFKDKFPDIESMIGGGILLSGLIGFISKIVVKKELYDK